MAKKEADSTTNRPKRSPLRIGLSSGIFIAVAILVALIATQVDIDRRVFVLALVLFAGLFIIVQVVARNPKNKQDVTDEAETCAPIIKAYRKSKSVDKLMSDYATWKTGEHSTYTRMHFGEQIIAELRDVERYDIALNTLYDMGTLPFKSREHYDYDKYRTACEAELLAAIAAQEKNSKPKTSNNKNKGKKKK